MRLFIANCLAAIALSACAGAPVATSSDIQRVLADPARSAADRERDARDKPAEVYALARFKRGDTVADLLGGGGYNSEILSGIVGPEGKVLLVNNPGYDGFGKKGWTYNGSGEVSGCVDQPFNSNAATVNYIRTDKKRSCMGDYWLEY